MADEGKTGGWMETLLGYVIILLFVAGALAAIRVAYTRYFVPSPGLVSLSAYFVDEAGTTASADATAPLKSHLKVKGDISQGGQLVKDGSVRLTISTAGNGFFRQSVFIPFQSGHFETEDPAFRLVRPGEQIEIKAEVTTSGLNETATIYLNRKPPVEAPVSTAVVGWSLFSVVLFFVVVFFVAFTGKKTAFKNRTAIVFSYLVIAIFLAVPIVAPTVLLRMFPGAVNAMIGKPAGLVNTHTPDEPEGETQWALNIGGFSVPVTKPAENPSSPATHAAADTSPSAKSALTLPSTLTSSDQTASTATAEPQTDAATPVKVTGGLLIPLYVIILSVIGGAINMTRKVPGFQKEGEESDFPEAARRVGKLVTNSSMVGTALINSLARPAAGADGAAAQAPENEASLAGQTQSPKDKAALPLQATPPAPAAQTEGPEASFADQAQAIDDQLVPLVTLQLQRNSESDATLAKIQTLVSKMQDVYQSRQSNEALLKFSSFEDWAASHPRLRELLRGGWRVELLNQYMYLISAPFLAIVTYYILDLLGLSKQGVVVVLSFSVGLVSERIVSWILGIATGYLRTDTGNTPAKAA